MYIRDMRIGDVETNAPVHLRAVNATDKQIELFINDRIKPIRDIIDKANAQIENIQADKTLSKHGKDQQVKTIGSTALEALAVISENAHNKYSSYLSELSRRVQPKQPYSTGNEVLDFLQQQEIRKELSSLSQEDVLELYRKASESGSDERLVRAIEDNPLNSIRPIVSADHIEQVRHDRIVKDNPEVFDEINLSPLKKVISLTIGSIMPTGALRFFS